MAAKTVTDIERSIEALVIDGDLERPTTPAPMIDVARKLLWAKALLDWIENNPKSKPRMYRTQTFDPIDK